MPTSKLTTLVARAVLGLAIATAAAAAPSGSASEVKPVEKVKPAPGTIDINTADEKVLESLPRIGPAIAKRIVEYRKQAGGFRKVEELLNVQGIGERTLEELRPLVTVSGARTEAKP